MRCFVALSLSDETLDYIRRIGDDLKRYVDGSFVPVDNLHITLAFLGEISVGDVDRVNDILFEVASECAKCDISLQKFILLQKGTIAALEIKKNPALVALRDNVCGRLKEAGFNIDDRSFRPHVTLARRISYELPYREICKLVTIYNRPNLADDLVFYCSTLKREGAFYQPLQCFKLTGE